MRILFAIQGTGNGHVSRARDIIPFLQKYGELDILISGTQVDVSLPQNLAYRKNGVSFVFGKHGGVDYWKTLNGLSPLTLINDIRTFPIKKYDLIINDFEPVTAWAAKINKIPIVALSHQCSFLSDKTPRPIKRDKFTEFLFKYYAPSTHQIGFHFEKYDDFIETPIIRKEIRELVVSNLGHYTVYLPAYDDRYLVKYLAHWPNIKWEVFSKHEPRGYHVGNVQVLPVLNEAFNISLASCEGLLTGGGFEAPAEAIFLSKKVFAIPMKGQYEQLCNAEGLKRIKVPVGYDLDEKHKSPINDWINHQSAVKVDFPDNVERVVKMLFEKYI